MKVIIFFLALIFSTHVFAQPLECRTLVNKQLILNERVETVLKEKVLVGKTSFVTVYVTETTNNIFVVEGFLPTYEARIYAQGVLRDKSDMLTASLWGRDVLVEIVCRKR